MRGEEGRFPKQHLERKKVLLFMLFGVQLPAGSIPAPRANGQRMACVACTHARTIPGQPGPSFFLFVSQDP